MSVSTKKFFLLYAGTIGLPLFGLLAIFRHGRTLSAPVAAMDKWKISTIAGSASQASSADLMVIQAAVILAACALLGHISRRLHQPTVMGEMIAGILLGPSFLGWIAPSLSHRLFPPESLGSLNALSQMGLILFMFLVGLKLNLQELKNQRRVAVLTSHVSIAAPLFLGALLALYLYPRLATSSVSFTGFALFMGAAMSITAFPVLARILAERNMLQGPMGMAAITCAAVDDVSGWCIVAGIMFMTRPAALALPVWLTTIGILVFAAFMVYVVRPWMRRFESFFDSSTKTGEHRMLLMLVLVLVAAFCSAWLGVHLLFGAFLLGAIMPKERAFVRRVSSQLGPVVKNLLLPLFFAFTGLRTNVSLISGMQMWFYCILIFFVAVIGKFGSSTLAAWCMGKPLGEAAALGILMNTRGLMELVILNIGLDAGIISSTLFSMMVIMAVSTTLMTAPILDLLDRSQKEPVAHFQAIARRANDSVA